jgi:hypothetical protein
MLSVQAVVTGMAIERLNKSILWGLSGLNEVLRHLMLLRAPQRRLAGQYQATPRAVFSGRACVKLNSPARP